MRACRIHQFGPPEVIVCEDVPIPTPSANELLVRVAAAGVGPWDALIRSGQSVVPQPLPLTLGSDLSGVVERIGRDVHGFASGDAVFGVTNERFVGAYAQYAIVEPTRIAPKPRSIDDVSAAAVPVVAVTAFQALFDRGGLTAKQRVLVHGGAGSVGSFAVQMAREAGAHVIATASARDLDYVRGLGANEVLDYRANPFDHVGTPVDLVLDAVGGETLQRSFDVVRHGGRIVSIAGQPDVARAEAHGVRAEFMLVNVTTNSLERIADSIDRGSLTWRVGTVIPLERAREAHEMLEGSRPHAPGKIVLRVHGS